MKANELRIGNLVYNKWVENGNELHKDERKVSGYDLECLECNGCFYQEGVAEPIPLTEEWLLKFGFKRIDMMFENIPMLYWRENDIIVNADRSIDLFTDKEVRLNIRCEYVHQLQNLYFALTGNELEIK
jgi:hypothetical protein